MSIVDIRELSIRLSLDDQNVMRKLGAINKRLELTKLHFQNLIEVIEQLESRKIDIGITGTAQQIFAREMKRPPMPPTPPPTPTTVITAPEQEPAPKISKAPETVGETLRAESAMKKMENIMLRIVSETKELWKGRRVEGVGEEVGALKKTPTPRSERKEAVRLRRVESADVSKYQKPLLQSIITPLMEELKRTMPEIGKEQAEELAKGAGLKLSSALEFLYGAMGKRITLTKGTSQITHGMAGVVNELDRIKDEIISGLELVKSGKMPKFYKELGVPIVSPPIIQQTRTEVEQPAPRIEPTTKIAERMTPVLRHPLKEGEESEVQFVQSFEKYFSGKLESVFEKMVEKFAKLTEQQQRNVVQNVTIEKVEGEEQEAQAIRISKEVFRLIRNEVEGRGD